MRLPHSSVSRRWASLCKQGSAQPRHQQALTPPRTRPVVSDPVSGLSCYRERWPFHPHTGALFQAGGGRSPRCFCLSAQAHSSSLKFNSKEKKKSWLRGRWHVVCLDIRAEVLAKAEPSDSLENQVNEETAAGGEGLRLGLATHGRGVIPGTDSGLLGRSLALR